MQIEKISQTQLRSILDEEKVGVVSAFLEKLRLGANPTPRSPLFSDKSTSEVFEEWMEVLNREESKYPQLVEYDKSRMSKVGPQGGYPPLTDRMDDFKAYFTSPHDITVDADKREYLINKVREMLFGNERDKRPLSYERVVEIDIKQGKLNTNSGPPGFGRRSDPENQKRAIADAYSGKWEDYPAIVGSRGQRGKDRFYFLFPFSANIVEKSFLIPLMETIRKRGVLSFSAWEGFGAVEQAMHKQQFFKGKTLISMDFTTMDKYSGEAFMDLVFEIIAPYFQKESRDLLKRSLYHSVRISLMIGIDKIAYGSHGLASGSGWTNFTESVFSQCVRDLLAIGFNEPLLGDQGLGDDSACSFITDLFKDAPDRIADVSAEMGQNANPDKQRISSDTIIYLQRFFDTSITIKGTNVVAGSYPSILALNSAMNPERFHDPRKWNEKMEIIRWIMILENCNHLPYFTELIEFVMKGDKFKLGLTIPGFLKRGVVTAYDEARSIPGFIPSYNQANL